MRTLPVALSTAGMAAAGLAAVAAPALAADLTVSVEIPTIATANYHRPYVAIWIERADQSAERTLAVWYDVDLPGGEGKDYLKDLRTWWRKGGRAMTMPADGVSGATRAPGRQSVTIPAARLRTLAANQYNIVVEAAREQGGREAVRVPFRWGGGAATTNAAGTTELRNVRVAVSR